MRVTWRHCRDLSPARISVALVCAPLPVVAYTALVSGVLLSTMMLWYVLTGIVHFFGACFFQARISRLGCLFTGAVAGISYPYAWLAMYALSPSFPRSFLDLPEITVSPILALGQQMVWPDGLIRAADGCLFGCLTGWLVWRLGVRPAPQPQPEDLGEVFR